MNSWMIHWDRDPYETETPIYGETLSEAIEASFDMIGKKLCIGNVAGWSLDKVWMQWEDGILGGKGGVVLSISAYGSDALVNYVHEKAPKLTTVWIHASKEDCPELYYFDIRDNQRKQRKPNITDKQIYVLCGEAANYDDPDAYASDAVLSILDTDDSEQEVDITLFEQLRILWHVANDPFKILLESMGLNQTQCSVRFCIPLRTVQDWAGERRVCSTYIRLMMAEIMGLLNFRDSLY